MRKRIGVLYFDLMQKRGAESVAAWALTALRGEYEVTLITAGEVDAEELNRHLGTRLDDADFEVQHLPAVGRLLAKLPRFAMMKQAVLNRYVQAVAKNFDLIVGLWNELDAGRPGLQYVHIPVFLEDLPPEYLEGVGESPFLKKLRRIYRGRCRRWAKVSASGIRQNATLANSAWTAEVFRRGYGVGAQVLYPPVVSPAALPLSWKDRENGFVCAGALVPGKNILRNIDIISRLRELNHEVHLHVVGAGRRRYAREVERAAAQRSSYVFLEGSLSREKLLLLLRGHRYGIHGCNFEHFGIAVAEMVSAGCIVFVPDGGGQVEIVNHSQLVYRSEEDAIRKIDRVLRRAELQSELVDHLRRSATSFSPEKFMEGFRSAVKDALTKASGRGAACLTQPLTEFSCAANT